MSSSTGAVFLSYASEDSDAAARIADTLKAAGIEVWFDRTALRGGDAWDRQIRLQIHDCRLFLAVVSARTEARVEGYFRREWKLAVDRTLDLSDRVAFLIPIVIDDTSEAKADVPDAFRHVQWTRLRGGTTTPAFVSHVASLLNREPIAKSGSPALVSAVSPLRKRARSSVFVWLAIGLSSVIVLEGAYYLFATLHHRGAAMLAQSATASAMPEKSIAVLPFVDMSEKKGPGVFCRWPSREKSVADVLARIGRRFSQGRLRSSLRRHASKDEPDPIAPPHCHSAVVGAPTSGQVQSSTINSSRASSLCVNSWRKGRNWSGRWESNPHQTAGNCLIRKTLAA